MEFLDELEAMAQTIGSDLQNDQETIDRWCHLFNYTASQAAEKLDAFRTDLNRTVISAALWETIRAEKEAKGYDKEAYEYSLGLIKAKNNGESITSSSERHLFKLEYPVDDISALRKALKIDAQMPLYNLNAVNETGQVSSFCEIDGTVKAKIQHLFSQKYANLHPTFVRDTRALKDLSPTSAYPTLGQDTTLPQHRPANALVRDPNMYPVWYFFYGTLAAKKTLQNILDVEPHYIPAKLYGGKVDSWRGKYLALMDSYNGAVVEGHACLVEDAYQENALRVYETDQYEIVRCGIHIGGNTVDGLTFRFRRIN
ncbi:Fc.00g073620.m01.CDS01 [Cosmosporella sp. VM-42]